MLDFLLLTDLYTSKKKLLDTQSQFAFFLFVFKIYSVYIHRSDHFSISISENILRECKAYLFELMNFHFHI